MSNKSKQLLTMKYRIYISSFIALFAFSSLSAQNYQTSIGLRLGLPYGVSIKHFFAGNIALEGIVSSRYNSLILTGLIEFHQDFSRARGLAWFIGGGAHFGLFNGSSTPWFGDNSKHAVIGVDGILGLEYTLPDAPLSVSLDMKPTINISGDNRFLFDEGSLTLRYIIR